MDESTNNNEGVSDAEFAESMHENATLASPVSRERAEKYYDRIRKSILEYLGKKGPALGKSADYLLLVPDIFILLWRLVNDSRVNGKNKLLLGSGIAYYLFPFDILPEGFIGPAGFMDDLVFAVYVLNRMIGELDPAILREHWSGSEDLLMSIRRVLDAADNLVGTDLVARLKKMMK